MFSYSQRLFNLLAGNNSQLCFCFSLWNVDEAGLLKKKSHLTSFRMFLHFSSIFIKNQVHYSLRRITIF